MKAWLSVIIPTYNGEKYLAFALESIAKQQELDIECIVVDDGSNDSTVSIIKSYQSQIPLRLIQRERQGNWVANTNYALNLAAADYICFLHQDDLWLPDRLKIMKDLVFRYPNVNLFLHPTQFINANNKVVGNWQCPLPKYPQQIAAKTIAERLLVQNFIAIPAPIFKRELALSLGSLDNKLWYTADWDFWLKIALSGKTIYYPTPLAAFRIHPDSQTIKGSAGIDKFQEQLELVFNKYCSNNNYLGFSLTQEIFDLGKFSIVVNKTLAAKVNGYKINLLNLLLDFFRLGVVGAYRYLKYSRIWERTTARLKIKLIES
jgi:glycosyltransferase involved in cell wall biosynthesis